MGKYSSVAATALKNTCIIAMEELESNKFESIRNNLNSASVLQSSVCGKIASVLNDMDNGSINGSLSTLTNNLSSLCGICEMIEQIQNLEIEVENLKSEIAALEKKKYDEIEKKYTDANGNLRTYKEKRLNQSIVNRINEKYKQIQIKMEMIEKLEKIVDSALG